MVRDFEVPGDGTPAGLVRLLLARPGCLTRPVQGDAGRVRPRSAARSRMADGDGVEQQAKQLPALRHRPPRPRRPGIDQQLRVDNRWRAPSFQFPKLLRYAIETRAGGCARKRTICDEVRQLLSPQAQLLNLGIDGILSPLRFEKDCGIGCLKPSQQHLGHEIICRGSFYADVALAGLSGTVELPVRRAGAHALVAVFGAREQSSEQGQLFSWSTGLAPRPPTECATGCTPLVWGEHSDEGSLPQFTVDL